jgi:agmatinase
VGAVPVVLGGDHSILWPDAGALIDIHGVDNLGLIHLDAHADCGKEKPGMIINHSLAIPRLVKQEGLPGSNIYQVGLRGYYPDEEMIKWMRRNGLNSHFMAQIERIGLQAVLDEVIRKAQAGPKYFYVSFDIDVLDPAFAPGTGTPEPGGLLVREALTAVRRLCHELNVVGFEIVEVAPNNDSNYVTALTAHRIVIEAITGIAMRKLGIEGSNYLDPVTSGEEDFPQS